MFNSAHNPNTTRMNKLHFLKIRPRDKFLARGGGGKCEVDTYSIILIINNHQAPIISCALIVLGTLKNSCEKLMFYKSFRDKHDISSYQK